MGYRQETGDTTNSNRENNIKHSNAKNMLEYFIPQKDGQLRGDARQKRINSKTL